MLSSPVENFFLCSINFDNKRTKETKTTKYYIKYVENSILESTEKEGFRICDYDVS